VHPWSLTASRCLPGSVMAKDNLSASFRIREKSKTRKVRNSSSRSNHRGKPSRAMQGVAKDRLTRPTAVVIANPLLHGYISFLRLYLNSVRSDCRLMGRRADYHATLGEARKVIRPK
jgi:hypothetical protein